MDNSTQDPLEQLFGDRKTVNRELLANALSGRIWLDRASGTFHFHIGVRDDLGRSRSILIALLAQKALALVTDSDKEGLAPREIEAYTGFKGGTIRPVLQDLVRGGVIARQAGQYAVPDAMMEEAIAALS
jgi:hypothetical protein